MVFVPNLNENDETEIEVQATGSPVDSSERLEFVLKLIGLPSQHLPSVLQKAQEMGLTGNDLGFIQQQDIDALLSSESSLQKRKLMEVCEYVKSGGTLTHGMTMTDIYNQNNEAPPPTDEIHEQQQQQDTGEATQQEGNNDKKDWVKDAGDAFYKIPGQIRRFHRFKRTCQSIVRSLKSCLPS